MQRIIHSEDTLEMLECAVDLRFNQGKDRVSLWVLGLWQKLSTTCKYQENWRDAYTTVEQVVKDPIVAVEFPTAEHVFGQQKWNNNVKVGKPVMIGDNVTQSMIQVMQAQLGKLRRQGSRSWRKPTSLLHCEMSRPESRPIRASNCGFKPFNISMRLYSVLTLGKVQLLMEDSILCIPVSMNTIGHGIFGDKLWEHDHRFLEQLVWFTTLVPDIVKEPILSNLLNPAQEVAYCDILEAVEAEVEGLDGPEYDAQEISTSKALYEQPTAEPPPVSDDSKKPNKLTSAWASFGFATQTLPGKTSKKHTADFKVNDSESKKQNTGRMLSGSQVGTSKSNQSTKTLREKVKAGIYDLVK
ncbi:MAG: hypothetical protein NXY57DRAFT_1041470 [Lentinula lateritia]|nr:MAG: hypothetical protein NXY57DRAFT_1041470 [Lentinula lateritia]